jgi:hypothetical protein|tara:strand:- start:6159 stop:6389 length:231 start_codon:yes stop_codon:yes gene_type:complete
MAKEEKLVIMQDDKEVEFVMSDLSDEGQAQYVRANELAKRLMMLQRESNELRFLSSNYIRFVLDELEKEVDESEKK